MKFQHAPSSLIALFLSVVLSACSIVSPSVEPQAATQTALAGLPSSPTDSPVPTSTETPLPPVQMQQQSYEGVSFAYSPDILGDVQAEILQAAAWAPLRMRGTDIPANQLEGVPDSIRFELQPAGEAQPNGEMLIFPVKDTSGRIFPALNEFEAVPASIDSLENDLSSNGLPANFFRDNPDSFLEARTHRVNFQNGAGFSTLSFDDSTVAGGNLFYLFEGLTSTGNYYVALRFPVTATGVDLSAYKTLENTEKPGSEIIDQTAAQLEDLDNQDFIPNLSMLDTMVASLRVEPTLPAPPTMTPEPECINRAEFVAETVEDGSVFSPGEAIEQTWTLRNTGTCTWSPEYRLVLVDGEPMGYSNENPVTLNQSVPPGTSVDLSVNLIAPEEEGRYEGDFNLQNPAGENFGVGADTPFWVRISVVTLAVDLELGAPDYLDTFESDRGDWFLGGVEVQTSLENGALVVKAVEPVGDRWRVSERPGIGDFYIEMQVETGETCSEKDTYGLILRAPEQEDNIIDTGYVFGFSCDGMMRVYRMADGQYASIRDWFEVTSLSPSGGNAHRIGVWADGQEFQVFVDGSEEFAFSDPAYSFGKFGLVIRAEGEEDFTYAVDEIAYWLLP